MRKEKLRKWLDGSQYNGRSYWHCGDGWVERAFGPADKTFYNGCYKKLEFLWGINTMSFGDLFYTEVQG